jgi:Ca2+-binding RTX toxin-like protein
MKRTSRVLVAVSLVVLLSAGAVLAALPLIAGTDAAERIKASLSAGTALAALPLIIGTNSCERITGTNHAEEIRGLGGSDEISDRFGTDLVYGGTGEDNLIGTGGDNSEDRFHGGRGKDIFQPRDVPAVKDIVSCGAGTDTVYADQADVIGGDCERVRVR